MKLLAKLALGLTSLAAVSAQAYVQYDVTNTSVVNCSGAPHGLWTNSDIGGGSCSNYFSIDGVFTLYNDDANQDNWYAELDATATNPQSKVANIDLTFSGFEDASAHYKKEGGATYDASTMDFFTGVAGTIDIDSTLYDITHFVGSYTFQFGQGANAKSASEFGASAWIQSPDFSSHHWDLNLAFTPVAEPGTVALFGLGIFGLVAARRRVK